MQDLCLEEEQSLENDQCVHLQLLQAGGGFAPDRSWADRGTPRGIPALGSAMDNQLKDHLSEIKENTSHFTGSVVLLSLCKQLV